MNADWFSLIEKGGPFCIVAVVLTAMTILLSRMAFRPLLTSLAPIVHDLRTVTGNLKEAAETQERICKVNERVTDRLIAAHGAEHMRDLLKS